LPRPEAQGNVRELENAPAPSGLLPRYQRFEYQGVPRPAFPHSQHRGFRTPELTRRAGASGPEPGSASSLTTAPATAGTSATGTWRSARQQRPRAFRLPRCAGLLGRSAPCLRPRAPGQRIRGPTTALRHLPRRRHRGSWRRPAGLYLHGNAGYAIWEMWSAERAVGIDRGAGLRSGAGYSRPRTSSATSSTRRFRRRVRPRQLTTRPDSRTPWGALASAGNLLALSPVTR
jgi:hypothetical protein